jgi:hypothetical protein
MAPEQFRGVRTDHRSDIYGVGAVLYHALTGEPPYGSQVVRWLVGDDRVPRAPCPRRPRALAPVVDRALARQPEERFPHAEAMLAALRATGIPDRDAARLRRRPLPGAPGRAGARWPNCARPTRCLEVVRLDEGVERRSVRRRSARAACSDGSPCSWTSTRPSRRGRTAERNAAIDALARRRPSRRVRRGGRDRGQARRRRVRSAGASSGPAGPADAALRATSRAGWRRSSSPPAWQCAATSPARWSTSSARTCPGIAGEVGKLALLEGPSPGEGARDRPPPRGPQRLRPHRRDRRRRPARKALRSPAACSSWARRRCGSWRP